MLTQMFLITGPSSQHRKSTVKRLSPADHFSNLLGQLISNTYKLHTEDPHTGSAALKGSMQGKYSVNTCTLTTSLY